MGEAVGNQANLDHSFEHQKNNREVRKERKGNKKRDWPTFFANFAFFAVFLSAVAAASH
jgi:hypothetical protein